MEEWKCEEHMKTFLISAACLVLAAAALAAQDKPAGKAAGLGKPGAESNEEMNIRAYIELLRTDVKKFKSDIMGQVMQLDASQNAQFWPIYKDFESDYASIGDQIVAAVRKYADTYDNMTDAVADQLGSQILSIEQQRNELKKKYYDRLKEKMGAITAARFLQVENQLERVMDLQLAAQLPVIGK